jgi:hypothetical protein
MRANIGGIQVEGTPEEIMEFKKLLNEVEAKQRFKYITVNVHNQKKENHAELLSSALRALEKHGVKLS